MSRPHQPDPLGDRPEQSQPLLDEIVARANRAIEGSRAEVTRSQALGRSVADLTRELDRISEVTSRAEGAQKDSA
jgi:hypothetical protein